MTAAGELDAQLRATAPLVSASVHATEVVVEQSTADAVRGLDITAVAETIPGGVSDEVLRPVLAVYSELVSRVQSMRMFAVEGTYPRVVEAGYANDGEQAIACLANGSDAAGRFTQDLAAARAAAAAAPPVVEPDPTTTEAAALAVRIEHINLANGGCASCGGHVVDELAPVVWDDESATTRTGSIGGISFTATYDAGLGWTVRLNAC